MRHLYQSVGSGLLVVLAAATASAEISLRFSNQQLTDRADVIVIGRATGSASRWIGRTLVTAVTVQVTESLKGAVADRIEVLLPGGVDANRPVRVAMTYAGAPQVQNAEELFLFLTHDARVAGYVVTGFAQGKFSIVTQRGTRVVSRDLRGSQLVEGPGIARGTATLTPLADFRQEVTRYLGR
jgi:hypothetical protein